MLCWHKSQWTRKIPTTTRFQLHTIPQTNATFLRISNIFTQPITMIRKYLRHHRNIDRHMQTVANYVPNNCAKRKNPWIKCKRCSILCCVRRLHQKEFDSYCHNWIRWVRTIQSRCSLWEISTCFHMLVEWINNFIILFVWIVSNRDWSE